MHRDGFTNQKKKNQVETVQNKEINARIKITTVKKVKCENIQ